MQGPKRQHYIDQALLRNFFNNGQQKLWVYDRVTKQYRYQKTDQIALERHLYSLQHEDLQDQRFTLEEALAGLTGTVIPAIDKLRNRGNLSQQEWQAICEYAGLQTMRTPERLKIISEVSQRVSQYVMEESILKTAELPDAEFDKLMEEYRQKTGAESHITKNDWVAVVREKRLTMKQPVDYEKAMMVELGTDIGVGFSDRQWIILHTKPGQSFIGSDTSVAQQHGPTATRATGVGPLSPGIQNVFPIAKDTAILITDKPGGRIEHATIKAGGLRTINGQLAQLSSRIIFSHSKALLESIVSRTKIDKLQTKIVFDDEAIRDYAREALESRKTSLSVRS